MVKNKGFLKCFLFLNNKNQNKNKGGETELKGNNLNLILLIVSRSEGGLSTAKWHYFSNNKHISFYIYIVAATNAAAAAVDILFVGIKIFFI